MIIIKKMGEKMDFNLKELQRIISDYKKNISKIHDEEIYKWKAVKHFQDNWDVDSENFPEMLKESLGKTYNLLVSQNFYPKRMICELSEKDPEFVRNIFINLYDEKVPPEERISQFISSTESLFQQHYDETAKSHFQTSYAVSLYLFLRYPEKHYIFKYKKYRNFAKRISYSPLPLRGKIESVINYYNMCDKILEEIKKDSELLEISKYRLQEDDYNDEAYHLLTDDIVFFGSLPAEKSDWWPSEKEYNPGISKEEWIDLINNPDVFTKKSLTIMKRMLDYGGEATCKQLSEKYGENLNFYNAGSSGLAKRVWKETDCPVPYEDTRYSRWWPIIYVGKYAKKDDSGIFIWKIRPELKEALQETDLSHIALFTQTEPEDTEIGYWWLNANPRIWSFSEIKKGEEQSYSLVNENGNKRRIYQNFLDVKTGDFVIGYESTPVKQIVALCKISRPNDGKSISFEKIESFSSPIEYGMIKELPGIQTMEFFINPNGSLFKLTEDEYTVLIDLIREQNPLQKEKKLPAYDKNTFLSQVYMDEYGYDSLKSLLLNKKNIILQGAPGTGKTFAAKRLAYSLLGHIDEDKIEMVQFHQNYSYEDFVMGYKPTEDGFKMKTGIFFKFALLAGNNPDDKFFFIIDEINRGNMSKIFGELLMLLEKDYRGTEITMAYSGMKFSVPENLYIIGMMNTADRSLAMIDYALRRRFSFFDMTPAFRTEGFMKYGENLDNETFDALIETITALNREITHDPSLGEGFCIGHSYFCGREICTEEWISEVINYELIPMLKEYWFDDKAKVQEWTNRLLGVIDD